MQHQPADLNTMRAKRSVPNDREHLGRMTLKKENGSIHLVLLSR